MTQFQDKKLFFSATWTASGFDYYLEYTAKLYYHTAVAVCSVMVALVYLPVRSEDLHNWGSRNIIVPYFFSKCLRLLFYSYENI